MKKFLVLGFAFFLVGCGTPTHEEKVGNVATDQYVQVEIAKLEKQLAAGEVTEAYAREKLKQILKERVNQNAGTPESILKKMEAVDPAAAEMFRKRIKEVEAQKNQ